MAFYFGAFLIFPQISLHLVFCLIAGVLGLHLTFIFLGREAKSREIYKVKCQSQFKGARKFSSNQFIRSTPSFSTQISGPLQHSLQQFGPMQALHMCFIMFLLVTARFIHEMQRNKYVVASTCKLCSISKRSLKISPFTNILNPMLTSFDKCSISLSQLQLHNY